MPSTRGMTRGKKRSPPETQKRNVNPRVGETREVTIASGYQKGQKKTQKLQHTPGGTNKAWANEPCTKCTGSRRCANCKDQMKKAFYKAPRYARMPKLFTGLGELSQTTARSSARRRTKRKLSTTMKRLEKKVTPVPYTGLEMPTNAAIVEKKLTSRRASSTMRNQQSSTQSCGPISSVNTGMSVRSSSSVKAR